MKFRIDLKILIFLVVFFLSGQLSIYLMVLFFALLHELAHLLVALSLGFKPTYMEFMPFGFRINLKPKIGDYKRKILKSNIIELKYILVAIAGPLLNLAFVIIFRSTRINEIIYSNFLLLIFNLIPIYPLDGGRVFQSMLRIILGRKRADKYTNIVANMCIIILTIIGSVLILYLKNIAILAILAYLWNLVIMENKRFNIKNKILEAN